VAPLIARLGAETSVKLAISLNATTDEQRAALMPINRRWPIAELMAACRRFPMKQGRRITFEYVLLAGVNDTDGDARRLVRLVSGLPSKVNLIPYNENPGLGFTAPAPARVAAFRKILLDGGLNAVVRRSRGQDVTAACGQLAVLEPSAQGGM
jgi:23S rRNA (adenine2503-C2)-methyltransferase